MNFLGIIPARYASTRFPGKPLADIGGKTMIQRVYEQVSSVLENVIVATDDDRIYNHVKEFEGEVCMTSETHQSGTDRCKEALDIFKKEKNINVDVVINIQGDEPFIRPDQIESIMSCFQFEGVDIATLVKKIDNKDVVFDPNKPKVVCDVNGKAIYFSRSPIPYLRGVEKDLWLEKQDYFQHIGMYAYKTGALNSITQLEQGALEKAESLEQLRWLENNYIIQTAITKYDSYGIDTPEDLEKAKELDLF